MVRPFTPTSESTRRCGRGSWLKNRGALPDGQPVLGVRPDDHVADVAFETAPPVRRAAGNDDHVTDRDAAGDAALDARATGRTDLAIRAGFIVTDEAASRQRPRSLQHVIDLRGLGLVEDGVARQ